MMGMRFRTLRIVAAVITLAAFAMPHSQFGSEICNRQFLVSCCLCNVIEGTFGCALA
jgi:hypothetical protein